MARGREVYQLTLTRDMYNRPLLQDLGKRFRLIVTLRRAILNEEGGFVELSLDGAEEEIGRAIADLQTFGVNTTGPIADESLVEPNLPTPMPMAIGRGT